MTEEERKLVVERIDGNLEKLKILKEYQQRLEKLEKVPEVIEYLEKTKAVKYLSRILHYLNDEQSIINWNFTEELSLGFTIDIQPCKHDVWIYTGSYSQNSHNEELKNRIYDEINKSFRYNKYTCLECGEQITTDDWQEFEKNNYVLKNRKDIDSKKYTEMYYQFLYNYPVETSRKMLIEEFEKNKPKIKIIKK